MVNKFINNNRVNLLHTQNKKTKVESQIEMLKNQEQAINKELWNWETKHKKAERLANYLSEVNEFSTKFLTEAVKDEREKPVIKENLTLNKNHFLTICLVGDSVLNY